MEPAASLRRSIGRWRFGFVFPMLWTLAFGVESVAAADVRVYCASALREPMLQAARVFAHSTSHRVEFIFASVGAVHKRIAMGERADVVVGSAQGIDALVGLGMGTAGSKTDVAKTALALAGRSGADLPQGDDPEALRRALASARVLGVPDARRGAPGAAQADELLRAVQLPAEARTRIRWLNSGADAIELLVSGGIDMALVWMSEVAGVADIAVAGPIVSPPTKPAIYAAAVPRSSKRPELGRAFITYLRSHEAAKVLRRAGYLPID